MNTNRQNNRCITPGGPGYGGRPGGRPVVGPGCNNVCAAPASNGCDPCVGSGVIGAADGCNTPCTDGMIPAGAPVIGGGGIVGQSCENGCGNETVLVGLPLGMAYVPWQTYGNLYSLPQGVKRGTIFQELDFDFMGRRCN